MVKPQLLIILGCLIGLAGTLADMFFNGSDSVVFPLLITGIVVMLIGIWARRRLKNPSVSAPTHSPRRRFALYLLLTLAAGVVGFFGVQHSHPDFSLGLILGICIFTFVFCAVVFYWQLFIRAK